MRCTMRACDAVRVDYRLAPAWTTDWLAPEARERLRAFGIAPPGRRCAHRRHRHQPAAPRARARSRARAAARRERRCCRSSARPPARRSTAAATASSRSTISSRTERPTARRMSKFHRLPIARVDRETRDAVAITFDVPADLREQFRYAAGQHLTLRADVAGAGPAALVLDLLGGPRRRAAHRREEGARRGVLHLGERGAAARARRSR